MDFITQHVLALISTSGGVVPAFIDYLSVIAGVLTGALVACDRKLDIIGVTALGLVTGYGGGMFRDFFVAKPGYCTSWRIRICCLRPLFLCVVVFFFRQIFDRIDYGVFVADALFGWLVCRGGPRAKPFLRRRFRDVHCVGRSMAVGGGRCATWRSARCRAFFKSQQLFMR